MGIDVSNLTLDICVRQNQTNESFTIANQPKAIKVFLRKYSKKQLVIGMENTGRYNWALFEVLADTQHKVHVLSPLHLKKSIGLVRGKNDVVDAIRIASFVEKNHEELRVWISPSISIQKLKVLIAERNTRIKSRAGLKSQQHDYNKMRKIGIANSLQNLNDELVQLYTEQIKQIEAQIEEIIEVDELLNKQRKLIQTIPGVGKVLSWIMLSKTEGFSTINDPRKMACYSGVVPFDYQSGTSINGKKRVSCYADKSIKSILHLAAMSAIRLDNDLKTYYLRKVESGKNKMSVLNAIRNKIIHRIFAVIKNNQPYQKNFVLS